MKRRALNLLVLLSILLGVTACGERSVPAKTMTKRIARLFEFYEESGQFSGAVLVAQDGNIIYEDAFGWADREWRTPNTVDTKFRVASITKQFTAAAILVLEMDGKLSTNDAITEYFDSVPEDKHGITLHHLLTHTSGLPGASGHD